MAVVGEGRGAGPLFAEAPAAAGATACVAADFNGDSSLDLAVAFVGGDVYCCVNHLADRPGVRIRLKPGMTGPVTVSAWQGGDHPFCTGASAVFGHTPGAHISLRHPGPCTLRVRFPRGPVRTRSINAGDETQRIVLGK